jgi:hypothetical protein
MDKKQLNYLRGGSGFLAGDKNRTFPQTVYKKSIKSFLSVAIVMVGVDHLTMRPPFGRIS